MHPIERLRYVARAEGAGGALIASEAATALAEVAQVEPAGLLPGCRRLIERHLTAGPVWWLSARMLAGADPRRDAAATLAELEGDDTERMLVRALPDDTTVLIVGWPDVIASALRRRGDVEALVLDGGGDGYALARRLDDAGTSASAVPDRGVGSAAAVAGLVLVEASVAGPDGVLAAPGSRAAAAVAADAGVPVWAVTGAGRVLPGRLWEVLLERVDAGGEEPWNRDVELVPAHLLSGVVGPTGWVEVAEGLTTTSAPVAPELLRDAL